MRTLSVTLSCLAACALTACGPQSTDSNGNSSRAADTTAASPINPSVPNAGAASQSGLPPVTSAHGGAQPQAPAAGGGVDAGAAKPSVNTAELDAKIEKADAKAKAGAASDADKKAAAAAYVERGNVYYSAGSPALYKFALGDFRRALRYDPANDEARAKLDQIVQIYQSLGRPVPTNGTEQ